MSGGSRSRGLFDDVDDSKLKHKEIEKKISSLCFVFCVYACICLWLGGNQNPLAQPVGVEEW